MITSSKPILIIITLFSVFSVGSVLLYPDLFMYLRISAPSQVSSFTKIFTWTPQKGTQLGEHILSIEAIDEHGHMTNRDVTITVAEAGSGTKTPPGSGVASRRVYRYPVAQTDHKIEGPYSGIVSDTHESNKRVAKMAANTSMMSKRVRVPRDNYWLDLNVKHDKPGPVDVAVYLNNTAWKIIRFDKNDNQYRTHRIGLLRDFDEGVIRFRLLNDTYDRNDPGNEDKDRNLFIDWWGLSTEGEHAVDTGISPRQDSDTARAPAQTQTAGRSLGWQVLPRINQIIREELGNKHVTTSIWTYYASRLTLKTNHPAVIQTEDQLRNVMRYWLINRPSLPKGNPIL